MSDTSARTGVLLVNLGTPASPSRGDVRSFLREFLGDPRVLDMPALARHLLLELTILPFRPRTAAAAYAKIWSDAGSPLAVHGRALTASLGKALGHDFRVELGMRYGNPAIDAALARLSAAEVERVVAVPLFPQYSSAAWGSAAESVYRGASAHWDVAPLSVVPPFYAHPGYVRALGAVSRSPLAEFGPDHVLMSYHGLPERQLSGPESRLQCPGSTGCCDAIGAGNTRCYRAHCFATSRALAGELGLGPGDYSVAFQSRMGRIPWIRPFTDQRLIELADSGVRRLAVTCPSFVADCLETVEEIGIRGREQWRKLGGDDLLLVPCLNSHPDWVDALANLVREFSAPPAPT
jgi:ferrochelatase